MVVHHGNANIHQYTTSCGLRKYGSEQVEFSVSVNKVNCIECIERLLKRQLYETKKTPLWKDRLRELKEVRMCSRYFEQQKLI